MLYFNIIDYHLSLSLSSLTLRSGQVSNKGELAVLAARVHRLRKKTVCKGQAVANLSEN
jgi:hypothetical protein|uniref:Uncharacterized protein n=1 Tax=Zea mays TaxID=4577 RepID=C0PLG7_MAIZE|nr:unknown [Zea mays]